MKTRKDSNQAAVANLLCSAETELSTTKIAQALGISKSAVNNHCNELLAVGAVYVRKAPLGNGQFAKFYVISPEYKSSLDNKKKSKEETTERSEGIGTQRFINYTPLSGQIAMPRTAPPMNTTYKPILGVNYVPSSRAFLTSGQGKYFGEPK